MTAHILFFTQSGCLSCELMRVFLEARALSFEEHDVRADSKAYQVMTEKYGSNETPTLVVCTDQGEEVVTGFDPERIDFLLAPDSLPDSVTEN